MAAQPRGLMSMEDDAHDDPQTVNDLLAFDLYDDDYSVQPSGSALGTGAVAGSSAAGGEVSPESAFPIQVHLPPAAPAAAGASGSSGRGVQIVGEGAADIEFELSEQMLQGATVTQQGYAVILLQTLQLGETFRDVLSAGLAALQGPVRGEGSSSSSSSTKLQGEMHTAWIDGCKAIHSLWARTGLKTIAGAAQAHRYSRVREGFGLACPTHGLCNHIGRQCGAWMRKEPITVLVAEAPVGVQPWLLSELSFSEPDSWISYAWQGVQCSMGQGAKSSAVLKFVERLLWLLVKDWGPAYEGEIQAVIDSNKAWGKRYAAGEFKPVFGEPEQLQRYYNSKQPDAKDTPALYSDSAMVQRRAVTPLVGLILAAARSGIVRGVGQRAAAASEVVLITPAAANQNQTGAIDRLDAPAGEVGSGGMASLGAVAGADPMCVDGGVSSSMQGVQSVVLKSGVRVGPLPPLLPPPRPPPGSPVPPSGAPAPQPVALPPSGQQQSARVHPVEESTSMAPQLWQYTHTPAIRSGRPSIAPWACAENQVEWKGVAAVVKRFLICRPEWKRAYFVVQQWPEVLHVVDLLQPYSMPQTMPVSCLPALPMACNLGEYSFWYGRFSHPLGGQPWVIFPKNREADGSA